MSHIAAIHVLKKQLRLTDDDYRALLRSLTQTKIKPEGLDSCAQMNAAQHALVRSHMQRLAERMGLASPQPVQAGTSQFTRKRIPAKRSSSDDSDERWGKARTLWAQLAKAGAVQVDTDAALLAYVKRQTRMEAWRFLNGYQINMVIESLKRWLERTTKAHDVAAALKQ